MMPYAYWFVRKICERCKAPFSCSVEQDTDRSWCAACESKTFPRIPS